MEIALRGSSPCATVAAILLITRARQLGLRMRVTLVGDPTDIATVHGPALVASPVLASCGIGRDLGVGAAVVVRGPPGESLMLSLHPNGTGGWFSVDRAGTGVHPATQAFMRLADDPRPTAQAVGRELRKLMETFGMAAEPAVLDLLFGAPTAPLQRLALALRAGRAMHGGRKGEPVTRWLTGTADHEPIPATFDRDAAQGALARGDYDWIVKSLAVSVRDRADGLVTAVRDLAEQDGGRDLALAHALAELASHLVQLPAHSILPPLSAHEDSIAMALGAAVGADGSECANHQLQSMFQFLGGKYVKDDPNAHAVDADPLPEGTFERWGWFCDQAEKGRKRADELWPLVIDPPQ